MVLQIGIYLFLAYLPHCERKIGLCDHLAVCVYVPQ
jgi:hypothetical protein